LPTGTHYRNDLKIYRFDAPTFDQGIEPHAIEGITVRIGSVARTLRRVQPHLFDV
jgi:hypothetical protein